MGRHRPGRRPPSLPDRLRAWPATPPSQDRGPEGGVVTGVNCSGSKSIGRQLLHQGRASPGGGAQFGRMRRHVPAEPVEPVGVKWRQGGHTDQAQDPLGQGAARAGMLPPEWP